MSLLIVIPARGGSKGLPGKNLRTVGNVSLVGRAVLAAREFLGEAAAPRGAAVLVDTDSEEIAAEGVRWGAEVPFLRPPELATDTATTTDSVLHAAERWGALAGPVETLMLLQPTSPLRTGADVARCWHAYVAHGGRPVVSVTPWEHPIELALRLGDDDLLRWAAAPPAGDVRRQAFAPAFRANGAVYVVALDALRATRSFFIPGGTVGVPMPPERSIDVDTAADLAVAEALHAFGAPHARGEPAEPAAAPAASR
jgi:CMP-N-acetylneuraminic acid synthetase